MNNKDFQYIALNKPYGILSQFTGENPDETLQKFNIPKNVYAVGRLDKDSEGLLILSDDGAFIDTLLTPKYDKEKTYLVQVEKIPTEKDLDILRKGGVQIQDYKTRPCRVKIMPLDFELPARNPPIRERKSIPTCWLEIKISEGKNRQVRRMTAAIGFPTLRLIRTQVGKFSMPDHLLAGAWMPITKNDII